MYLNVNVFYFCTVIVALWVQEKRNINKIVLLLYTKRERHRNFSACTQREESRCNLL